MQTLTSPQNIAAIAAGVFSFDARKSSTTKSKVLAPVYYIEDSILDGDSITVDYTLNDNWLVANINYPTLKTFVLTNGLNDYCYDYADCGGNHVQDSGTLHTDTFIAENLNACLKAYLEANKAG